MTLHPQTVTLTLHKALPYWVKTCHKKTPQSNISSLNIHQVTRNPTLSHVGSLFLLSPMLPQDGVNLLLHEGPRHLGALQRALVSAGTIGLQQDERLNKTVILHYDCHIHLMSLVVSRSFKLSEVCTFGPNLTVHVHYTIPAKLVLCCPGCWSRGQHRPYIYIYIYISERCWLLVSGCKG